ncbi:mitochondrial 3-oxoacyl-(acyl carrier protein) synthase II [Andalucia godoyi]|uniref:3-oxoacyl-[acyl-carrier-protein] synthase n=1 Tax=Andalucia godoyi TaxID=505711 RepID=A0A8K0AGX2_ANDGO|nr:mitochondrial 3-oxoacyl-(acyl carrier protein) synthase II [Andalucia godoyi]|eukprot:ANDGO_08558.mRNA.1 mitochondrial 3-oxoacyl-(acyl carrier protein) synthase II
MRRVVVTGLGCVSPFGVGRHVFWQKLKDGQSGITALRAFDCSKFPSKIAGSVPRQGQFGFNPSSYSYIDERMMAPFIQFAMVAATEAVASAGFVEHDFRTDEGLRQRTGVSIASGIGGIGEIVANSDILANQRYGRISPYFIPKMLINLAAGHVAIRYGLEGPCHAVSTACASAANSIGDSYNFIRLGMADIMICGGTEAATEPVSFAGFCRAQALSTKYNDEPEKASRPFDKNRDGFVMSEGAGILVLEEYERAKARGAEILAEIKGYAATCDAHHITKPNGPSSYRCMADALRQASISSGSVDYVNAHATSTPAGDAVEARNLEKLFANESRTAKPLVSSLKGALGHMLGASGGAESVACVLSLSTDLVPPTLNLVDLDPVVNLPFATQEARHRPLRNILKNSFGFGGVNVSLVFGKPE